MPQEFLVSFAVDIDEGGVTRLQTILSQNRDLASQPASASYIIVVAAIAASCSPER